jgi:hypothetical protein
VPSVLHSARCPFISNPARTNYTAASYYKICSDDRNKLVRWLNARQSAWKVCSFCTPPSMRRDTDTPTGRRDRPPLLRNVTPPTVKAKTTISRAGSVSITPLLNTNSWHFWRKGEVTCQLEGLEPRLASWDAASRPSQIRLRAYLKQVADALGTLPESSNLFLHLDVDVQQPERLLRHYDLENYLTPLVHRLGSHRFVLVSATKRVGGGSELRVGIAAPAALEQTGWAHFVCRVSGSVGTLAWKTAVRQALIASNQMLLPPGPVSVRLAWRCAQRRNWVQLWKPTGDAMGPVLGEPDARNPFNPADDRIVSIELHRSVDDTVGNGVDIGMWWRSAPTLNCTYMEQNPPPR